MENKIKITKQKMWMRVHVCCSVVGRCGQRVGEEGQYISCRASAHTTCLSSHNSSRSEVKKKKSPQFFYTQTAATNSKIYSSCGTTGKYLSTSDTESSIRLEIKWDRHWLKTFKSSRWCQEIRVQKVCAKINLLKCQSWPQCLILSSLCFMLYVSWK